MPIQNIPNLVQGVSQQAAQQRRDSQCESQFDCFNSAADGADARPPTELARLKASAAWSGAFLTEFYYEGENYLIGYHGTAGLIGINLTTGADVTITAPVPGHVAYLAAGAATPADKLRAQVAEDTIFVTNNQVTVAMVNPGPFPPAPNEALIFCRASNYSSDFRISLEDLSNPANNISVVKTTSATAYDGTAEIINDLFALINGVSGWSATKSGSVMKISRADNHPLSVVTSDDNGDDYLLSFVGEAESYSKLPPRAFNGMILKVKGDNKVKADDFYVKWVGSPTTGNWQETVAPRIPTQLDAATMPHAFVRTAPNTFEFRRNAWSSRIAGDLTTVKDPTFVGRTIRDVFYHQRRLAFLHRTGAIFSKAQYPFTFFPDTVQAVLDTAPIDLLVSPTNAEGSNDLRLAVQVQENLYLWAQQEQHMVGHNRGDGFSQKTVETDPSSAYEFSPGTDPVAMGSFLFFTTEVGDYFGIKALQFQQTKLLGDIDVTAHLPNYMVASSRKMTGSQTLRSLFVYTSGSPEAVYLLNYTHDGQQFVQQAVNTWRLPGGTILWMGVRSNILRILQQRPEGVALLKINLTAMRTDGPGHLYLTRLDMRLDNTQVTESYNPTTDLSTVTIPYVPTGPDLKLVTKEDKVGGFTRGREFPVVSQLGPSTFTFQGDCTGYEYYIGQRITAELEFSEFFIRTDNGSEPTDLLSVNRWTVACSKTGYSRLEVKAKNQPTAKVYEFPVRRLGGPSATTGTVVPSNGDVTAPVGHASKDVTIKIINDSYLPSRWQNGAVEYTAVGWKGLK